MQEHFTTKQDYELFKKYCREWIVKLGLKGWEIDFMYDQTQSYDNQAETMCDFEAHRATITLNRSFGVERVTKRALDQLAFHECFHLVTEPLYHAARRRSTTDEELDASCHVIIHTVASLLFGAK